MILLLAPPRVARKVARVVPPICLVLALGSLKKVNRCTFIKSLAAEGLTDNTIARVDFEYKSILLHALDVVLHQQSQRHRQDGWLAAERQQVEADAPNVVRLRAR
jgi:hypothetical protein